MTTTLRFQGKVAFATVIAGSSQQYFLTKLRLPDRSYVPAMSASQLTSTEKCILYQDINTKDILLQLASLDYLTLMTEMGWIEYSPQLQNAAWFQLSPLNPPAGTTQTWQVLNGSQFAPISYTQVGNYLPPSILTINAGDGSFTNFTPHIITPGLDAIAQSKSCQGGDFINVDLSGQDVSGVDFTGANFTGANLTGAIFKGAILTQAIFVGATLDQTIFDGATLDQADFSGANTVLTTINWGHPKSAQNIIFSGCDGRGTKLVGSSGNLIPCNLANFTNNANFSGATLSYLTLDDADLTGAIAAGANFTGTSLQRVKAHGANFCGAILDQTNLSNSQFGAKALLFALTTNLSSYITELNNSNGKLVPPDIAAACKVPPDGIDVSNGIVTVLVSGQSWLIATGAIAYNLLLSADGSQLLVYRYGGATAATFSGASLSGSTSTGANFSSVDLSNSVWDNGESSATKADHTDLESTNLTGSFLGATDFTQAMVAGTLFSNAVLIGTIFKNVQLNNPSFTNAQLQGTDFTNATLINGNLYQTAIALALGVPLFVMNNSYSSNLQKGDLTTIASVFQTQGYPLGNQAQLSSLPSWLINNAVNTNPPCIQTFYVDPFSNVYDFSNLTQTLFTPTDALPAPPLNSGKPTPALITWFQKYGYPLSAQATISSDTTWQIITSSDAPVNLPVIYQYIWILSEPDGFLHVYGIASLWQTNPNQNNITFGTTQAIRSAINAQTICPNGQPKSEFDAASYTWEQMMTCPAP